MNILAASVLNEISSPERLFYLGIVDCNYESIVILVTVFEFIR